MFKSKLGGINNFAQTYEDNDDTTPLTKDEDSETEFTAALSTITGNTNKQAEKITKLFDTLIKQIDTLEKRSNVVKANDKENINPRTNKPNCRYCWLC